jgi:hypothetical protein
MKGILNMSRLKSVLAISLLVAIVNFVPQAQGQAATAKAIIAGSSAIWQSMALGAYNFKSTTTGGSCITGFVKPCFHYTYKSNSTSGFQVNDRRPTHFTGGTIQSDVNTIWIVWDSHTTTAGLAPNYIAYIKVDSVVGDRCYYGQPRCDVTAIGGTFPTISANENQISVWPDGSLDQTPPSNIQAAFLAGTGPLVSAAATDVRAEDGAFAMCRANSAAPGTLDNQMKGLGYNANNATPGQCPTVNDLAHLTAGDISDASGSTAHILAFNVTPGSHDPFTGTAVVTGTTVAAGAAPIVFIDHTLSTSSPLYGVTGVRDSQLQALFANTGAGCDGTTLGGTAGNIDAWVREPLSGTYNTTEFNVFSYPDFSGTSQEAYLNVTSSGGNPLNQQCPAGGGNRIRGVGTSHVIDSGTVTDVTNDSIAYAFFSYGNVKKASDATCSGASCHYLTLNGVDPIFHKYVATAGGTKLDPGQPNTFYGEIPSATDTPCGSFPCAENQIWAGGLSFPNLRSGQYSAWSVLRLISNGTPLTTVKALITASQAYSALSTPDFVPVVAVAASGTFKGDPGLQLLRSHYQQVDALGTAIGGAPVDDATTGDVGGDVGGCIEHFLPGVTANQIAESDSVTGLIHTTTGTECSFAPTSH